MFSRIEPQADCIFLLPLQLNVYTMSYMFIQKVAEALASHKVPFALAGGYAVALHGAVRGTVDVDLIIRLKKSDFVSAEKALKSIGLAPRLPVTAEEVFEFRKEYIERRNLIAWSFVNPNRPIEIVDILLTENLSDHDVVHLMAAGIKLPVLALDDLIAMKRRAGRPQDLEDVRALRTLKGEKR